jgi:hypothetical protein
MTVKRTEFYIRDDKYGVQYPSKKYRDVSVCLDLLSKYFLLEDYR